MCASCAVDARELAIEVYGRTRSSGSALGWLARHGSYQRTGAVPDPLSVAVTTASQPTSPVTTPTPGATRHGDRRSSATMNLVIAPTAPGRVVAAAGRYDTSGRHHGGPVANERPSHGGPDDRRHRRCTSDSLSVLATAAECGRAKVLVGRTAIWALSDSTSSRPPGATRGGSSSVRRRPHGDGDGHHRRGERHVQRRGPAVAASVPAPSEGARTGPFVRRGRRAAVALSPD